MERFADELDLAQFRIDQVTELAIAAIRKHAGLTVGREYCIDCGERIPDQRLVVVPTATRCAVCQDDEERQASTLSATRFRTSHMAGPALSATPGQVFGVSSAMGTGRRRRVKD
ncbi:TraR/DksA C4-type zinc finger protein [uncultured Thiodictyon sp.]|uniref:TraR/DksA C4-type zinc finger protein n=1 Tax=uncultured Thiodictyon sp. TaxID=1846217 RepID=UPI0025E67455|nr:TraR/DksA C4-type zinc finger protein [uncultured Thiodictyon sp.]